MNYDEYLRMAEQEHIEKIKKGREIATLSDLSIEKVKGVRDKVNILVFGETRCGDAATAIPYLIDMAKINSNIIFDILRKEGNEERLNKLSGDVRIPTFIKLNENGESVKCYIEFPEVVKKEIEKNKENKEKIVFSFRDGMYKEELEREILELIVN